MSYPRESYLTVPGEFNDTQIAMAQAQGIGPRKLREFVQKAKERTEELKELHETHDPTTGEPDTKRQRTKGGRKTRRARKNKKRQQKKSRKNYK
jgi:hypothetical protein